MILLVFKMALATVYMVVILISGICTTLSLTYRRRLTPYNPNLKSHLPNGYSYQTLYLTQDVDHFGFRNNDKFKLRYLFADQFWNHDEGPIFFYTGNEGDITWFCNNTGFMWDIAPEFKALLVFAEHRYYGDSLPYGSASYDNSSVLNYLTAEQALADFAELITYIKGTVPGADSSPVIVFGGSYGGMLSAWMRIKYPNLVLGALAASAPIWQFTGLTPCGIFYQTVQNTFQTASEQCADNIARAWSDITGMYPSAEGMKFLSDTFSLCKPLESKYDLADMLDWITGVLTNLAMVDYPYPASFLEPLPAWPVQEFCSFLSTPLKDKDLLIGLSKAMKMYFNFTGNTKCLNISQQATPDLGDRGWDYQACTEMVMPLCSDGSTMFYNIPWDFDGYSFICKQTWGVLPRQDWISLQYWGKNLTSASNIIFSNGLLDPWSGGGVLENLSSSLIAIQIPYGAHHLDLRASNINDTRYVRAAREQEKYILKNWLFSTPSKNAQLKV